jgi:hypothetical protein
MSYLVATEDVVKAYIELRERMIALLRGLPEMLHRTLFRIARNGRCKKRSHMMGVPEAIMLATWKVSPVKSGRSVKWNATAVIH